MRASLSWACALALAVGPALAVAKDAFPFEWSKTKYLFAFGDSYTTTFWKTSDGRMSPDRGMTMKDGSRAWINYLTQEYNETDVFPRNLARAFATIDNRIITNPDSDYPVTSQFKSWKEEFDPAQAGMSWKSEDTLFITWIGINDVLMSYQWTDYPAAYYNDLQVWLATQESLYEAGARQFLFFTVPPIHRTPELSPRSAQALRAVRTFNTELKTTIEGFRKRYRDANVMVYDAFHRVGGILDQAQEEGIQLWNDAMHPHTGIHERIAIDVVKMFHELAEDEGKHKGEKGRGKGRKGKEDVTRKRPHWGSGH